jgi:hypothetical protein
LIKITYLLALELLLAASFGEFLNFKLLHILESSEFLLLACLEVDNFSLFKRG